MTKPSSYLSRSTLAAGLTAATAAIFAVYHAKDLKIVPESLILHAVLLTLMTAVATARTRLGDTRQQRIADFIQIIGLLSWTIAAGGLASYVVAASSSGSFAGELAYGDSLLGFDWLLSYKFAVAHPLGWVPARIIYSSIFFTPFVLVTALVFTDRSDRALLFVAAFAASLALTLLIFYYVPAQSTMTYFVKDVPIYVPSTGIEQDSIIQALRVGSMKYVDATNIAGLINFPSFHAVVATLLIWGAWPMPRLRRAMFAINVAMLIVTPVEGAHYLVDVIAGVALALAIIAVGHALSLPRLRAMPIDPSVVAA